MKITGFSGTFSYATTFNADITLASGVDFLDANGNELVKFGQTASAINEITITNNSIGLAPTISATGGDTNIPLALASKGGSGVRVATNFDDYLLVNSPGAGQLKLAPEGTATNIDVLITPKGTGVLQFGTHTGSGDVAVSGYVTINDATGTPRKLAVIT